MSDKLNDNMKAIAHMQCLYFQAMASLTLGMMPVILPGMQMLVAATCPNHPELYTEEEKKAHRESKK